MSSVEFSALFSVAPVTLICAIPVIFVGVMFGVDDDSRLLNGVDGTRWSDKVPEPLTGAGGPEVVREEGRTAAWKGCSGFCRVPDVHVEVCVTVSGLPAMVGGPALNASRPVLPSLDFSPVSSSETQTGRVQSESADSYQVSGMFHDLENIPYNKYHNIIIFPWLN